MAKMTEKPGCRIWWKRYAASCESCKKMFLTHKYSPIKHCFPCNKEIRAAAAAGVRAETLKVLDQAVANAKVGIVGGTFNPELYRDLWREQGE